MTKYKILLNLFIGLLIIGGLGGCAEKCPPPPEPIVKIVYKTKIVEVEVPCKIPKIHCEFSGTGVVPSKKAMECITIQKRALEACGGKIKKEVK